MGCDQHCIVFNDVLLSDILKVTEVSTIQQIQPSSVISLKRLKVWERERERWSAYKSNSDVSRDMLSYREAK